MDNLLQVTLYSTYLVNVLPNCLAMQVLFRME